MAVGQDTARQGRGIVSWLRLDDGFTKHPKFAGWTTGQKWAWLEVMEYCARYETRGLIPVDLSIMPRSTTPGLLKKALAAGWIDVSEDGQKWVHDWEFYNPSGPADERVRAALEDTPEASANDIWKVVGGRRKDVLALVTRFRSGSQGGSREPGAEPVGNQGQGGSQVVPEVVPRVRTDAPATRPVPTVGSSEVERYSTKAVEESRNEARAAIAQMFPPTNGLAWSDGTPIDDLEPELDPDRTVEVDAA